MNNWVFLKYCLGIDADIRNIAANIDWRQLYDFAKKQALLGFCFQGIERLGNEYPEVLRKNPIRQDLLMEWMGKAQQIRRRNMKVNAVAGKLFAQLRKDGLRCCVLKGLGNALMYPKPYSRTPGDIDVWVNAGRADIFEYAKKHFVLGDDERCHHLETAVDCMPVELHFMPATMNNPVYNVRLHKWFKRNADLQCSNIVNLPDEAGVIAVPTVAFNVIYQLAHLYHHFFDEGIGLRQLLDYYFVVVKWHTDHTALMDFDTTDLAALQRDLKWLGLWKFAGAVMFVLHEVFGLEEEKMIAPMNEKEGAFLLEEIMHGGNFGQYDDRLGNKAEEGKVHRYFRMSLRNMRFVKHYPSEAICEPLFRTWFLFWILPPLQLRFLH